MVSCSFGLSELARKLRSGRCCWNVRDGERGSYELYVVKQCRVVLTFQYTKQRTRLLSRVASSDSHSGYTRAIELMVRSLDELTLAQSWLPGGSVLLFIFSLRLRRPIAEIRHGAPFGRTTAICSLTATRAAYRTSWPS
jgi:hypothetical protein